MILWTNRPHGGKGSSHGGVQTVTLNSKTIEIKSQQTSLMDNTACERSAQTKQLQIATLNVCGLKTRSQYPEFIELCNNYDLLCFSETKTEQTDVISIPGFIMFNQCRRQKFERRSGGISVYVKENISKYFICINTESDCILVKP